MTSDAIVLPGGSYRNHAAHEAEPVAAWLSGLGLNAGVLRYPVNEPFPAAHDAIAAEVRRRRRHGAERVLLVGFSAGGHAAGLAALDPQEGAAVDAAILAYPVVSMEHDAHAASRETLLGDADTAQLRARLSLERLVREDAPPLFLTHALDDASVAAEHTFRLSAALRRTARPHGLVVFPSGGHGYSLGGPSQRWTPVAERWMSDLGIVRDARPPSSADAGLDIRRTDRQDVETAF